MARRPETSGEQVTDSHVATSRTRDDAAFAELLREAAHVSHPPSLGAGPLAPGGTLAAGRFQVLRMLGRGGMGVVYEVFDAERRCTVALKLLARAGADHVYRLKNEFRALVDLRHPHLVTLHELFCEDERWYYTMALVEGVPFDRYVRPGGVASHARLRTSLAQLLGAVRHIHDAGQLHRDLKPSNVLVAADGTLTVLDFGLSVAAAAGGIGQTLSEPGICGTPAYMAPEQAAGKPCQPASDLYAVGVMLFEALTGQLPFGGSPGEMIAAKQRDLAPSARAVEPGVPPELERLCQALLAREPAARLAADVPFGSAVARVDSHPASALSHAALFGRARELAQLEEALDVAARGRTAVVRVVGESGIGKTALCEAFVASLRGRPRLTLLTGRCYERESVPFKAFDPLIDALTRSLRRMSETEVTDLLPPSAFALTRLFPVLARVPAFAAAAAPHSFEDARALQQCAFAALAALFRRLSMRGPLVLSIDDLQWADADSLRLLRQLLAEPAGCGALLVASHRTEAAGAARLEGVFEALGDRDDAQLCTLNLGPLPDAATAQLVRALACVEDPRLDGIVRESGGHPLFAAELTRFARTTGAREPAPSLESALTARILALAPSARRLLELLALVGEPLLGRVALEAAGARHEDLECLQRERLLRVGRGHGAHGSGKTLECFHDRVRERICAQLGEADKRLLAARLAEVLQQLDEASAELVRRCQIEAGAYARAASLAAEAAQRAEAALAFERAAELYGEALAWTAAQDVPRRLQLGEAHARALALAGRSLEAAAAYRDAAALARDEHGQELLRRAARHLLDAGCYVEGRALLERICTQAGVRVPHSDRVAVAQLAWARTRLRLRGLGLASATKPRKRERIEALSTLVQGLTNYEPLHAAAACVEYVIMALDAGDPMHAGIALGQWANLAMRIEQDGPHVDALLARMGELVPAEHRVGQVFTHFMRGYIHFWRREPAQARVPLQRALALTEGVIGRGPMLRDLARWYLLLCAQALGDYRELVREAPGAMREMLMNGRGYTGVMVTCIGIDAWLVQDDPDGARRRIAEARRVWQTPAQPLMPDWALFVAEMHVTLYEGEPERALSLAEIRCAEFERVSWQRRHLRPCIPFLRGFLAAESLRLATGARRTSLRARLEQAIAEVAAAPYRRTDLGLYLRAALALARDRPREALACLRRAEVTTPRGVGPRYRAPFEWAIVEGSLRGDAEGARMVREGRAAMRAQGIQDIEGLLRAHLPGLQPA